MTTPATDPLVGTTIGSFRITKVIGRGGMGTVYLGEHAIIGSRVAIKVLQERLASDESLVSRFYAEARAVNLIGHENIVNIFDMNVVPPSRYYLVMEYLEGKPLNYLLTDAVPAPVAVPILVQTCDALEAAHRAGIIHRDLKPENIFLVRRKNTENFVKVLDFGLAKLLDSERAGQNTAAGLIVGTPEFMSPEQANSTPVDGRSDVYSLGCIAWLLATGRLPFPQRGLTDLLVAHRNQMPRPPHEVNPSVPRPFSDAIMRSMAKRPEARFQSAKDFGEALEQSLRATTPSRTIVPPPPPPNLTPPPASHPSARPGTGAPLPRFTTRFQAVVSMIDGTVVGTMECQDISKGGMFLSTTASAPPIFSRVKVTIPSAGNVSLLAEVVRHVPPEQARAWGMAPGFGVQFLDLTPQLRETIGRLTQGLAPTTKQPIASTTSTEALMAKWRDRMNGDHYVVLGVSPDADLSDIRLKAQESLKELKLHRDRAHDSGQRAQLETALVRVQTAIDVLGVPGPRARFDANRGNYRGISRCILGGLGPLDLERLRQEHLTQHPTAAGAAHVKFLASKGFEANGQLKEALDASEAALQLDPLNLQLHQRHAALSKRLREHSRS